LKTKIGSVAPAASRAMTLNDTVALRKNSCMYCMPWPGSLSDWRNMMSEKTVL
jgi:hypothetical protein